MAANDGVLRVFVSSPADVKHEREAVRRVTARLSRDFRNALEIDVVMWEWSALLANRGFQEQIPPPSESDVAIVILWTRLGTPIVDPKFRGVLSKAQVTGT